MLTVMFPEARSEQFWRERFLGGTNVEKRNNAFPHRPKSSAKTSGRTAHARNRACIASKRLFEHREKGAAAINETRVDHEQGAQ